MGDRKLNYTLENQFWSFILAGNPNECWIWTGALIDGYGVFIYKKKKYIAHRYSYELHNKEQLGLLQVLHSCDNRRCVNPKHLFKGTNEDNIKDRINKNKTACKENHGFAKLTLKEVENIKFKASLGINQSIIAQEYNIHQSHVSRIKNNYKWKGIKCAF